MALLKCKSTVRPRHLHIAAAVGNVAQTLTTPTEIVITAGDDGKHMVGSKHYLGDALDVRSKTMTAAGKRAFLAAVLKRLGAGYQGILESEGTADEHLHIEYDP